MGMNNKVFERIDCCNGVTAGNHHKIGRVEVYADSLAADIADKRRKRLRLFRTGFDSEGHADGDSVVAKFAAGFLHTLIGFAGIILRHNADMRSHYRRTETDGQICHQLAGGDFPLVFRFGFEAMATEITAYGGNDKPPIRKLAFGLLDPLVSKIFIEHIPFGHIHLHPLGAQFLRLIKRIDKRRSERIGHHADFKISHFLQSFPFYCNKQGHSLLRERQTGRAGNPSRLSDGINMVSLHMTPAYTIFFFIITNAFRYCKSFCGFL